jgi:hypothetical protein
MEQEQDYENTSESPFVGKVTIETLSARLMELGSKEDITPHEGTIVMQLLQTIRPDCPSTRLTLAKIVVAAIRNNLSHNLCLELKALYAKLFEHELDDHAINGLTNTIGEETSRKIAVAIDACGNGTHESDYGYQDSIDRATLVDGIAAFKHPTPVPNDAPILSDRPVPVRPFASGKPLEYRFGANKSPAGSSDGEKR